MTTSAPQRLDLAAAQDSLARSDEGCDPQPGDRELLAAYERHCQNAWDDFQRNTDAAEYMAVLAAECRVCGPDGATGPACDECAVNGEVQS
jgi:hypothetical protein